MAGTSDPLSEGVRERLTCSRGIRLHRPEYGRRSKMGSGMNDERDRMRHTAEALRQARGRVLQGSSNFLDIVQVIETFGKEHLGGKLPKVHQQEAGQAHQRVEYRRLARGGASVTRRHARGAQRSRA